MGDFHEPYGAIFGEFDKVQPRFVYIRALIVVRFLCGPEKLLPQPRKAFTRHLQPNLGDTRVVSPPSLILHGRTEIKARALVLGEVSALSFCHLTSKRPTSLATRRHIRHKIIKHLLLCFLCLFVAKSTSCFPVFVAQFASPILTRCPPM